MSSNLRDAPSSYWTIKDVARRLNAGTGSTGKNRYYVLIEGPTRDPNDDVILDVKQGGRPVPFAFFSGARLSQYKSWFPSLESEGVRHDVAYRALSVDTDRHVGYMLLPLVIPELKISTPKFVYFVRERNPYKATWEYLENGNAEALQEMCKWWGKILATQHSRSGKQFRDGAYVKKYFPAEFRIATKGKTKEFVAQVLEIAFLNAEQVIRDWTAFNKEHVVAGANGATTTRIASTSGGRRDTVRSLFA